MTKREILDEVRRIAELLIATPNPDFDQPSTIDGVKAAAHRLGVLRGRLEVEFEADHVGDQPASKD